MTLLSPEGSDNAYYGINGWAAASGVDPADVPGPSYTLVLQFDPVDPHLPRHTDLGQWKRPGLSARDITR